MKTRYSGSDAPRGHHRRHSVARFGATRNLQDGNALRSFAPSSSRGLPEVKVSPFGSTFVFLNDEVTRVVTCFARVVTNFAGIPENDFLHVFHFDVFSH